MPDNENETPAQAPAPQPTPSDAEVIQALIGTESRGDNRVTQMVSDLSSEAVFKGRDSQQQYERRDR